MTTKIIQKTDRSPSFDGLGISPKMMAVLDAAKFTTPTPIQLQAIPVGLKGDDIVGVAQTGTGKTLAYSIPALQRISQTQGQGLIILPTRELALQVEQDLQKIGSSFGLRVAVLIGGQSVSGQVRQIRREPHVIVATPGRLIDLLEQGVVSLKKVNVLILDEADRMLDMGFAPQIMIILKTVPINRQTMLFSATMPAEITRIATKFMKMPVRVEIARSGSTPKNVTQELFILENRDKIRLLKYLIEEESGSILVFTRTKHGAKKIARDIRAMKANAVEIHGNRSLPQRRDALEGFKSGRYRILVATDVASRGIDVTGINLVINYDLPDQPDDYVHRIGRTGRADHVGRAISLATPDQGNLMRDIEKLTRKTLPESPLPPLPEFKAPPQERGNGPSHPSRPNSRRSKARQTDSGQGSSSNRNSNKRKTNNRQAPKPTGTKRIGLQTRDGGPRRRRRELK